MSSFPDWNITTFYVILIVQARRDLLGDNTFISIMQDHFGTTRIAVYVEQRTKIGQNTKWRSLIEVLEISDLAD